MKKIYIINIDNQSQTLFLGAKLAKICVTGCVIYLNGCVGTGKTTLCKSFIQSLGYVKYVKSPTYTLVESYYVSKRYIHHIDFYRLRSKLDLLDIGIQDFYDKKTIFLIEWPVQEIDFIPKPDLVISINYYVCEKSRQIILEPCSNLGQKIVSILLDTGNFVYEIKI